MVAMFWSINEVTAKPGNKQPEPNTKELLHACSWDMG